MKEVDELKAMLNMADKHLKDKTLKVLDLIGKQLEHERNANIIERTQTNFWYNKSVKYSERVAFFKGKNLFSRIMLAIKNDW